MTTNSNTPTAPQDALDSVRTRKAEVKAQIKASSTYIKTATRQLFTPPPKATSKLGTFMNMVDQGMAIYDGVLIGMRVVRNVRRIFGRRK